MNLPQVQVFLKESGQPDYRFRQISKNYFSGKYLNFLEMTDLPLALRESLNSKFSLISVTLDKIIDSPNTHKARLVLADGKQIETVLMDYGSWSTVCVSSQVGCALGCTFCATGRMGFTRNLSPEEIVDQIIFWKNYLYKKNTNTNKNFLSPHEGEKFSEAEQRGLRLVFMGMGEPFLNFDNFVSATKIINSPDGLNIGQRKMSVSTAGVVPGIKKFVELDTQINLAISLHSADQSTRAQMMPIARQYSLDELIPTIVDYANKTNRQVFFEYLLAKNINDTPLHLEKLIDLISSHKLFYLNLIPLNPIKGGLTPSAQSTLNNFETELTRHHINYSIRQSLGQSAASACGQLIVEK